MKGNKPTIYFATDHAGFAHKEALVPFVRDTLGYGVVDVGARVYDSEDDFTDYIARAGREVSRDPKNVLAIILGGSGQGEAMLANRFVGVRACVYYGGTKEILTLSREHNDANVLSLGARFMTVDEAKQAIMLWLSTAHIPRLKYDRRIIETDTFAKAEIQVIGLPVSVVPSLPADSFATLEALVGDMRGYARGIQIDIVDGVFAQHVSWPLTETDPEKELQKLSAYTDTFVIEVDMMCMNPEVYIEICGRVGVQRIVIHLGATADYDACITLAHQYRMAIGIGLSSTTQVSHVRELVTSFDFVQVMGIAHIGKQGEPFDERALDTIAELRHEFPQLEIAVDGAVNLDTLPRLKRAGANRFAPGSAVAHAEDRVRAYKQLSLLAGA